MKSSRLQYAPFKPGSKGTLAARARELGLEPLAHSYLNGGGNASKFIKLGVKGITLIIRDLNIENKLGQRCMGVIV